MRYIIYFLIAILLLSSVSKIDNILFAQDSAVSVTDRGTYYEVIIDYTTGISCYEMGKQIAQKVIQFFPDMEKMTDQLITNSTIYIPYDEALNRLYDIKPQIPQEYLDEIDGLASILCSTTSSIRDDGKLSKEELCMSFISVDIFTNSQCSSISVFGPRSVNGKSITARLNDGSDPGNIQTLTQSVTTIKYKDHSICMIGNLSVGVATGFNDAGVFAALHSSSVGTPYTSKNKSSYLMDIRYALEHFSTSDEIASYIKANSKNYVENILIQLTDKHSTRILENNISGTGTDMRCALRSDTSALNPGITWGFPNAIATANSFVLAGNHDNHTNNKDSYARWNTFKNKLQDYGDKISLEELKQIASFDNGDGPGLESDGDIYNEYTKQITLFEPEDFHLEIAFKPRTGILSADPIFEEIPVHIGKTTFVDNRELIHNEYKLEQNYPNPFNPLTVIGYAIGTSTIGTGQLSPVGTRRGVFVQLKVYDILGNEVATLVNEEKAPGYYQVKFDADKYNLSSGIYFYTIKAGEFISTRKLILMK